MKKGIVLQVVAVLFACSCFGQTQEMEQLALNIQKLAQLKAMCQSMLNGYNTLSKGYNNVINISKGNFDLHKKYLDGLLDVNDAVRRSGKIGLVSTAQDLLMKENGAGLQRCVAAGMFSGPEISERKQKGFALLDESVKRMEEMVLVKTPGKLRMNDEERLAAIDRIEVSMRGLVADVKALNVFYDELIRVRVQNRKNVKELKALNGVR